MYHGARPLPMPPFAVNFGHPLTLTARMQSFQLRPLSLSELLDASFGMYRRLFAPLMLIAIVTQSIPLAFNVYLGLQGPDNLQLGLTLVGMVIAVVLGSIGVAASTFVVAETYLGGNATPQDGFARATPFLGRIVGASMLSSLLFFFGALFLIVPGIIVICGLAIATPAIVLENLGTATEGLRRSWQLTKGEKGKIFLAYLVAFTLIFLPGFALSVVTIAGAVATSTEVVGILVFLLIQSLLQLLAYPFMYILTTLLYYDMRVRKEAYDLEVMSASMAK